MMDEKEVSTELSEIDYNICLMAVVKCNLLWRAVKIGLPVNLDKRWFGFPDMTDDEEHELIEKLLNNSQLAWLKEQKNKEA
jgi:hypothetical protein